MLRIFFAFRKRISFTSFQKRNLILFVLLLSATLNSRAQVERDSTAICHEYSALIIPTLLIGYGAVGLSNPDLSRVNSEVRLKLEGRKLDKIPILGFTFTADDFIQHVPYLTVYGLNATGIKGENNILDRTMVLVTAATVMTTIVYGMKNVIRSERPDGQTAHAFPSGHTATAFMGAEFLRMEYRESSPLIGIFGYSVATFTGVLRLCNDKHWFNDVSAGAGIGILSTRIAYWLQPVISRKLARSNNKINATLLPFYNSNHSGIQLTFLL